MSVEHDTAPPGGSARAVKKKTCGMAAGLTLSLIHICAAGFVVSGCIVSHSAAVDRFLSAAGRHVVRVDGERCV